MTDAKFIDGMIFKQPHERAPDFVKASLSINIPKLIAWLQAQEGEWVNADMKESRDGKLYVQVNTYKKGETKSHKPPAAPPASGGFNDDDIPFAPIPLRQLW